MTNLKYNLDTQLAVRRSDKN